MDIFLEWRFRERIAVMEGKSPLEIEYMRLDFLKNMSIIKDKNEKDEDNKE